MKGCAIGTATTLAVLLCHVTPVAAQVTPRLEQDDGDTLTLFAAVERGLAVSPQALAAAAQVRAATARARAAGSARWPDLTAEGTATRFQEAMIVAPLHGFDPTAPPAFARTLFQSRWTAAYTLFDGGRRSADINAAQAAGQAAMSIRDEAEMSVIKRVAAAFLSVVASRELDAAEERRLVSLVEERERVQRLYDVGRTAQVGLLRADAALASARASKVSSAQDVGTAARELARLLSLPTDTINRMRLRSVDAVSVEELNADQLVTRALSASPQVAAARHDLEVRRAAERGARAAWFPTVRLAAGIVSFAGSGADLTAEWQGGIAVSYPIFLGGERAHNIAGAAHSREAAEHSVHTWELETAIGIERMVSQVLESRSRVAALTAAVAYAEEVARIEQLALSAGAGVQSDYLRAEAELFTARADLVRVRHGEIAALIGLAEATGDLSLGWLRDTMENRR